MLAYTHDAFDEDACQKLNAISAGYVSMCVQRRHIRIYDQYKKLMSWPIENYKIALKLSTTLGKFGFLGYENNVSF